MIYDKYKKRVSNWLKILQFIKKYKIAIISILSAIIVSVTGMLIATGTVTTPSMPIREFAYGDVNLKLDSSAFLSEVEYEFREADSSNWTKEKPTLPGKYYVRAKAKGSFGSVKYSDQVAFTIIPRPITFAVDIDDGDILYSDSMPIEIIEGSLSEGDVFEEEECKVELLGIGTNNVRVVPIKDTIKITRSSDSEDVTKYYDINVEEKAEEPKPLEITFSVNNGDVIDKTYDGTPLIPDLSHLVNVGSTQPNPGDELTFDYGVSVTNVNEGEVTTTVKLEKAVNSAGEDVTKYYNVVVNQTIIKINPKELSLTSYDETKVYDGNPFVFTQEDEELLIKGLADGQTLVPDFHFKKASIVNVKDSVKNDFDFTIKSGETIIYNSTDADHPTNSNYIVNKTLGEITVTPFKYEFTPHSHHNLVYNALAQGCGACAQCDGYGKTPLGQDIKVTSSAPKAVNYNGSTYSNIFSQGMIAIFVGEEDVTDNYEITFNEEDENGKEPILVINQRPWEISTHSHTYTYDGCLHGCATDTANCEGYGITDLNHSVMVKSSENSASCLNVGQYQNVIDETDVLILSGEDDVTYNYQIVCHDDGYLTVNKREITIRLHSHQCTYDDGMHGCGVSHCCLGYSNNDIVSENKLVGDHKIEIVSAQAVEQVGKVLNQIEVSIVGAEGNMDDNYSVSFAQLDKDGNQPYIEVSQREVIIKTHSHSYVYDGYSHGCATDTANCEGYGQTDLGHNILVNASENSTSVVEYREGGYQNVIDEEDVKIFDGNVDVTHNYKIVCENEGILTITKREITVQSHTHTYTYDGQKHGCTIDCLDNGNVILELGELVANHKIDISGSQTTPIHNGEYDNILEFKIIDTSAGDYDVTNNYKISHEGKITIEKRKILIKTHDHTCTYDGEEHGCGLLHCDGYSGIEVQVAEGYLPWLDGYTLKVENASRVKNVFD